MRKILLIMLLISRSNLYAQDSAKSSAFQISAYMETYWLQDFNHPENNTIPTFFYSYNRANEVAVNLAFVKLAWHENNIRANMALGTGTYMNANLAGEPGVLKNIYEANTGIKLSAKKELWMDAGIFASHIGFESAAGKDCSTLTRSILAENSPYYESGLRLSYTSNNNRWYAAAMLLNGWQHMQKPDGNTTPAFGTQITYKPNDKIILNSSTFVGNEKPDSIRQMRWFHDFYGIFQLMKTTVLTIGIDAGMEQQKKGSSGMNYWYSPVCIVKQDLTSKISFALRAEYYRDKAGVLISSGTGNGFSVWGYSVNFDYHISNKAVWRIEARSLSGSDKIFLKDRQNVNSNGFFSTAFCISL